MTYDPKHPREYKPRPEWMTTPDDVTAIFNAVEDDEEALRNVIMTLLETMSNTGQKPFDPQHFTMILSGTIVDLGYARAELE